MSINEQHSKGPDFGLIVIMFLATIVVIFAVELIVVRSIGVDLLPHDAIKNGDNPTSMLKVPHQPGLQPTVVYWSA